MKTKLILLSLLFLLPQAVEAKNRFALGPEFGFSFQSHRDPGGHLSWAPGLPIGIAGVYEFGNDLRSFAFDYSFGYSLLSRLTYRKTTLGGVEGTYREAVDLFHWIFGGRYYFGGRSWQPWKPFAGLGTGFQYFKRRDVEFRDRFNTLLPAPPRANHFNLTFVPQLGIEYRPTFRWAVGVSLKLPVTFRASGIVPAVQVPFTVQVAF